MEFVFQISENNQDNLELSKALEKLTELNSRQSLQWLWKYIDRLDAVPKASIPVLRRRAVRYKLFGVILLVLGILLLVPGLMEPSELLVPLISGAISMLLGLVCFLPRQKKPSRKFHTAAIKLLASTQTSEKLGNVSFTQEGMKLPDGEVISYDCFNTIVETESIYLLIWKDRVTVLQKRDLLNGAHEDFLRILKEKTNLVPNYVH